MSERVRIDFVCELTGMQRRHAQLMAKRGEIPSAARYGRLWTFHGPTVKQWAKKQEEKSWQTKTSIDVARPGGLASKLTGRTYAEAYERLLSLKRGKGRPASKMNSTMPGSTATPEPHGRTP